MPRFHVETLGCKVNLADSFALAGGLERAGYRRAAGPAEADLIVVNSCTVTARADTDLRQLVARLRRVNAAARLVVTGCLAELDPAGVERLPGVSDVLPNRGRSGFVAWLAGGDGSQGDAGAAPAPDAALGTLWDTPTSYPQFPAGGHTRAFVKVQDGCDARCSFCVIPTTRGRSVSLAPERVVEVVAALGATGAAEVVLTGIHLGAYGADIGTSLVALLDRLERLVSPGRIRLTSIEPNEVSDDLIGRVAASARFAPHFHLPLQSGSDRVLGRMRRPYSAQRYAAVVEALARRIPQVAIGADVIAGFPGETDADFAATRALIRSLPLSYLHPFRYSARPGTDAAGLDGHLPPAVAITRSAELRAIGQDLERRFAGSLVGTTERALTLARGEALAGRFVPLRLAAELPPNRLIDVRVTGWRGDELHAEPLSIQSEETVVCLS